MHITLNDMQQQVVHAWEGTSKDIIVLSPTGSGKTIAFVVPLLTFEGDDTSIIIVPSRELALQITTVIKKIVPGMKISCCYGGHNAVDESHSLQNSPNIIIGTSGRLLDHIKRGNINLHKVKCLILDEFDKSLELGFMSEMEQILTAIPSSARKILTSATSIPVLPDFLKLKETVTINSIDNNLSPINRTTFWSVTCTEDSKVATLIRLLRSIPDESTIIFSNLREISQELFETLKKENFSVGIYHGALDQIQREKAVAMFNNGSLLLLSATDLAARGLDISSVRHIIHFDIPLTEEIFTHRNGRTARVDASGSVYVLKSTSEPIPHFIRFNNEFHFSSIDHNKVSSIRTIYISAGKKEKISRGDIVGFLTKNAPMLMPEDIGKIDVFDHYSLVAIPASKVEETIKSVSHFKLKKQKVKLSVATPMLRFSKN